MNDWQALLNPDIQDFITAHHNDDVKALGLKKPPSPDWPYARVLDQIKSRQKAAIKIPQWLKTANIIFPASNTLEQGSSAATALYKASLFSGDHFADLTGGAGIDSWAMLSKFKSGSIIDQDENAATLIAHNLNALGIPSATIKNTSAEDFTAAMPSCDLALIDPQRRTETRKGLYNFEDCSPNVLTLLPALLNKAKTILLKTSPMMDIDKAIEQLGCVSSLHIIEWQGECKEILYTLKADAASQNPSITAVKINDNGTPINTFTFTRTDEHNAEIKFSQPLKYLYEPSPAFMKSGAYKSLALRYNLSKLHPHTHLYTSDTHKADFPGRAFAVQNTFPVQAKALPFKKANLAIRNFPQNIDTLKKKLKIKDGGSEYLFAATLMDNKSKLIHVTKIDQII